MPNKLKSLQNEKEALKKENNALNQKLANAASDALKAEFVDVNGVSILFKLLKNQKREALFKISDSLKANKDNYLIVLIGEENGGYPIVASSSKIAIEKGYLAGQIVREISTLLGGSGGGKPDQANGAGRDITKLEEAKGLLIK